MKFVSFRAGGAARYGLVEGNGVVDLTRRLKYPDLKALIVADAFAEAGRAAKGAAADFALDPIAFEPGIPNPGQINLVGPNYPEPRNETGMTNHPHPATFLRWAGSQLGHLAPMVRPRVSEQLDYEAELAVI